MIINVLSVDKDESLIKQYDKVLKRKDRLKKTYMVMQDVNHQLFSESVIDEVLLSMDTENIELAENILTNLNLIHLTP